MSRLLNITDRIKNFWKALPDDVKRVIHTGYQSFLGVFLLGITNVIADVLQTGDFSTAKTALVALVSAALAAAISAVKGALAQRWSNK